MDGQLLDQAHVVGAQAESDRTSAGDRSEQLDGERRVVRVDLVPGSVGERGEARRRRLSRGGPPDPAAAAEPRRRRSDGGMPAGRSRRSGAGPGAVRTGKSCARCKRCPPCRSRPGRHPGPPARPGGRDGPGCAPRRCRNRAGSASPRSRPRPVEWRSRRAGRDSGLPSRPHPRSARCSRRDG